MTSNSCSCNNNTRRNTLPVRRFYDMLNSACCSRFNNMNNRSWDDFRNRDIDCCDRDFDFRDRNIDFDNDFDFRNRDRDCDCDRDRDDDWKWPNHWYRP